MAVLSRAVTVTTSATRLDSDTDYADRLAGSATSVKNISAVKVYLGGDDVTTEGYELNPGEHAAFDLGPRDELHAIVASGTAEVRVLEVGV